jgi:hypothetical protein
MNDILNKFSLDLNGIVLQLEGEDTQDIYEEHKDQREDVKEGILTIDEVRAERGLEPL